MVGRCCAGYEGQRPQCSSSYSARVARYHTCSTALVRTLGARCSRLQSNHDHLYIELQTVHMLCQCSSDNHESHHIKLKFQTRISAFRRHALHQTHQTNRGFGASISESPWRIAPVLLPVFWLVPRAVSSRSGSPGFTSFILPRNWGTLPTFLLFLLRLSRSVLGVGRRCTRKRKNRRMW